MSKSSGTGGEVQRRWLSFSNPSFAWLSIIVFGSLILISSINDEPRHWIYYTVVTCAIIGAGAAFLFQLRRGKKGREITDN